MPGYKPALARISTALRRLARPAGPIRDRRQRPPLLDDCLQLCTLFVEKARSEAGVRHRPRSPAAAARNGRCPEARSTRPCLHVGQSGIGADGGTRTLTGFPPTDFRTTSAFAATVAGVRGLDYPFALHVRHSLPAFRRCPSSLYTFPAACRAWLGIAISQVSPNLSSSAPVVSRRALNERSSPLRLPIPPRPHTGSCVAASRAGIKHHAARLRDALFAPAGFCGSTHAFTRHPFVCQRKWH